MKDYDYSQLMMTNIPSTLTTENRNDPKDLDPAEVESARRAARAEELKTLNRKRHPTGQELGILEVERACEARWAMNTGDYSSPPVVRDVGRFMEKLNALERSERAIYDNYVMIHHWLVRENATMNYNTAAIMGNLEELEIVAMRRQAAEETRQFIAGWDLTMDQAAALPAICRESRAIEAYLDPVTLKLSEAGKREAAKLQAVQETILDRLFELNAFNYTLDRIAYLLGVSGAPYYKHDFTVIGPEIDKYNKTLADLKAAMTRGENAKKKLKAVDAMLKPILWEDVGVLDEETKEQIDTLVTSFKGFYGHPPIEIYYHRETRGGRK